MPDTGVFGDVNNLLDKDTKPETEVGYPTLILDSQIELQDWVQETSLFESQIESQDWVEELTTFELSEEEIKLNKTTYKLLNGTTHYVESETSDIVYGGVSQNEGNRSTCYSYFLSQPKCSIVHNCDPKLLIYISPTFESKATIKLPGEIDSSWKNLSYIQFSKIVFEKHYGNDKHVLQYSPTIHGKEEWTLDSDGEADPAYSKAGTQEIRFTSKEIKIKLEDQPYSEIESHNFKSPLTRAIRNQDFLVFLVLDIDGSYKILHSLKWRTEFEWWADTPDHPHHRWRILPNQEDIPQFDITRGTCNKNQKWYMDGAVLSIEEVALESDETK